MAHRFKTSTTIDPSSNPQQTAYPEPVPQKLSSSLSGGNKSRGTSKIIVSGQRPIAVQSQVIQQPQGIQQPPFQFTAEMIQAQQLMLNKHLQQQQQSPHFNLEQQHQLLNHQEQE